MSVSCAALFGCETELLLYFGCHHIVVHMWAACFGSRHVAAALQLQLQLRIRYYTGFNDWVLCLLLIGFPGACQDSTQLTHLKHNWANHHVCWFITHHSIDSTTHPLRLLICIQRHSLLHG
jgi:hypothetical protein